MKHLLLTFYVLLISMIVLAQDKQVTTDQETPRYTGIILNTTLSTLTETEAGPSLGVEYRLSKTIAFGVDVTALVYTMPDVYDDGYPRRGYRIRPEVKIFPSWGRNERRNVYFSLMGTYKRVGFDATYYDNNTGSVAYGRRTKQVRAISANMGIQRFVGHERRLMLELYAGLGLRYRRTTPNYYGEDDVYEFYEPHFSIDEDGYNPQVAFGFKLGHRF